MTNHNIAIECLFFRTMAAKHFWIARGYRAEGGYLEGFHYGAYLASKGAARTLAAYLPDSDWRRFL